MRREGRHRVGREAAGNGPLGDRDRSANEPIPTHEGPAGTKRAFKIVGAFVLMATSLESHPTVGESDGLKMKNVQSIVFPLMKKHVKIQPTLCSKHVIHALMQ